MSLVAISSFLILGGITSYMPAQTVLATHYTNLSPTAPSWLGTPMYFITAQPGGEQTVDTTIKINAANKWIPAAQEPYKIRVNSGSFVSGYTHAEVIGHLQGRLNEWKTALDNLGSGAPNFVYQGQFTSGDPSLFGFGCSGALGSANGINEISWCNLASPSIAAVLYNVGTTTQGGIYVNVNEVDMVFDSTGDNGLPITWSNSNGSYTYSVPKISRHEFGHWFSLADLYLLYGNPSSCPSGEGVMCNALAHTSLTMGDRAGVRMLYPKVYSHPVWLYDSLGTGNIAGGTDAAIGNIYAPSSKPDLLFLFGDYNLGNPQPHYITVKPVWNIDMSNGVGTAGHQRELIYNTFPMKDIGAALGDIDRQGDQPDLLITYTNEAFGNGTHYQVWVTLFDVRRQSGSTEMEYSSASSFYYTPISAGDGGSDAVIHDLNANGVNDMVLVGSRDTSPTSTRTWLYYGEISQTGAVPSLYSYGGMSSLLYPRFDAAVGLSKVFSNATKNIFIINFDGSVGYVNQHILNIVPNPYPYPNGMFANRYAPLVDTDELFEGVGASESLQLIGESNLEFLHVWAEGTNLYYTIEYETRIFSHP